MVTGLPFLTCLNYYLVDDPPVNFLAMNAMSMHDCLCQITMVTGLPFLAIITINVSYYLVDDLGGRW